jgi:hypothetical protein
MTPLARLGKRLPWLDEAGGIIKEFLGMPSPLCAAVGEVIREMGAEDVACHCDCQDRTYRFDVQYNFDDRTALVRDVACRQGLLHARSLDPGLDPQLCHDMMHRFDVSLRDVTYIADVKDADAMEEFPHLTARTWEEVGQVVHLATVRHFATYWT